ncbi:MAG: nuclear transport factor 2 family protein [Bacteroidota bacterium]
MRLVYLFLTIGLIHLVACSTESTSGAPIAKASFDGPVESKEEAAVKAAILDYVEGIYEADSTRIERSVHPELRKRGYWFNTKLSR